jgi:hypothetical protein
LPNAYGQQSDDPCPKDTSPKNNKSEYQVYYFGNFIAFDSNGNYLDPGTAPLLSQEFLDFIEATQQPDNGIESVIPELGGSIVGAGFGLFLDPEIVEGYDLLDEQVNPTGQTEGYSSSGPEVEVVTLPDGTRTATSPNGTKITTYPDGTKTTTYPYGSKTNVPGAEITTYPNGTKIMTDPYGSKTTTYPNGTKIMTSLYGAEITIYPDGSEKIYDYDGLRTTTSPDGSKTTTYPYGSKTNVPGAEITTYPNGTETATYPGGLNVITYPDGSYIITYPDGSETATYPNGSETATSIDGTKTIYDSDGTRTTTYPDGTRATTYFNGTKIATSSDGSKATTYPNGTITITFPDETETTTYPSNEEEWENLEPSDGTSTSTGVDLSDLPGLEDDESKETESSSNETTRINNADGTVTITYPDGTSVWITNAGSKATITYPDGLKEVTSFGMTLSGKWQVKLGTDTWTFDTYTEAYTSIEGIVEEYIDGKTKDAGQNTSANTVPDTGSGYTMAATIINGKAYPAHQFLIYSAYSGCSESYVGPSPYGWKNSAGQLIVYHVDFDSVGLVKPSPVGCGFGKVSSTSYVEEYPISSSQADDWKKRFGISITNP